MLLSQGVAAAAFALYCRKSAEVAFKPLILPLTPGNAEALFSAQRAGELIELGAALERLRCFDDRAARVVECRFFAGYSVTETAQALQVAPITV